MIYNGIALHDSFENGRHSCTITVGPNHISFSFDEKVVKFPLHKIQISSGGAGNRLIYFRHPDFPGWCFYSGDKALMKDPYLSREEEGRRAVAKIKSGNRTIVALLGSIVLFVLLLITAVVVFRKEVVYKIASTVPVEWETAAGEAVFGSIVSENTLIKDSLLNLQVNALGSVLSRQLEDQQYDFKFYIVEDSSLNAFALPGGNVVIHSGLILQADSVEELMGVLAHEIAHVTERHHARGLISRMGVTFLLSAFFIPDSELADLIITTGGSLQALKYDRELESEADEKGWEYLEKADINPEGMILFFHKMEKEAGDSFVPEFLSTHPATAERILELKKKEKNKASYPPLDFDFRAFKERLQKHLDK